MTDMTNAIRNTISISLFNRGMAGKVFDDVKKSGAKVVVKNNVAECVLLSPDEYVRLMEEVNDARLLATAIERMSRYDGTGAIPEADVLKELGISPDDIADSEGVEIE